MHVAEVLENADWSSGLSSTIEHWIQQVFTLVSPRTGVDVVHAGEKEMVAVDQIVGYGGEVALDPDEQGPAEVEDLS